MENNEIVRIIRDGKVVSVYHGSYAEFTNSGYKNYERPFIAQLCRIEEVDIAEYSDTKR